MYTEYAKRFSPRTWAKLGPYLSPLKGRLTFIIIMMLLSAVVDAAVPLFTRYAVNSFVIPQTTQGLAPFAALYAGVILFQSLTTVLYSRQSMVIEMEMGRSMKSALFTHLQKLPLSFFNQTSVGYLIARLMSDTNRISGMIAWVGAMFFWYIFYLAGILVSMFALNAKMALIVLAIMPFIIIVMLLFQPRLLNANREVREANSAITSSFNENITGAKTSKTLVIEEQNNAEFAAVTERMYRSTLHTARLTAVFLPIITFFSSMAVALVIYFSGSEVIAGTLDFGILSAFIAYAVALLDPMSHIAQFFSELMSAQVNIERVTGVLAQPCTITDSLDTEERFGDVFNPKSDNFERIRGDIEFENVWFRYPDADEDDFVLEGINLKIPSGTTVAIVGETGAGKTTLVNLACRFFEPTRGRILIDGADYRERSQSWLQSQLGYVGQTPHLFSGSIKDNLRYGKLDASDEDIRRAASLVSVDKVAARLESGYDTDVGEGGDLLSTGEKQLVSFGRAVIADPPIFVLDEATSSIDTETEALIQHAISTALNGRTSFIIAHRLSTIRSADLIVLIEGKNITERGSHTELMEKKGKYYRLYTAMMIKDEGF